MKTLFAILIIASVLTQPPANGCDVFAKVKFKPQLVKEFNEYFLIPFFDSKIRFYEGKEMMLEGYFIPTDLESTNKIILSKNPYSQCFFCRGAGPKSVAEVRFTSKPSKFKADQILKVTGALKLKERDINNMNFIVENTSLESNQ
jgi:hypothetical protein